MGKTRAAEALQKHTFPSDGELPPVSWLQHVQVESAPASQGPGSAYYDHLPKSFELRAGPSSERNRGRR
jgi:hypothetical protein